MTDNSTRFLIKDIACILRDTKTDMSKSMNAKDYMPQAKLLYKNLIGKGYVIYDSRIEKSISGYSHT